MPLRTAAGAATLSYSDELKEAESVALRGGRCAAERRGTQRLGLRGSGSGAPEPLRRRLAARRRHSLPVAARLAPECATRRGKCSHALVAASRRRGTPTESLSATRPILPIHTADPAPSPRLRARAPRFDPGLWGDRSGSAPLTRGRRAVAPVVVIRRDRRVVGVEYGKAERTRAAGEGGGWWVHASAGSRHWATGRVRASGCGRRRVIQSVSLLSA